MLLLSGLETLNKTSLNVPISDVTSIVKPTSNGEHCAIPYKANNYTGNMYFCSRGTCPTKTAASSNCTMGQFVEAQLSDDELHSFQLKVSLTGITGNNTQCLTYYYYISHSNQVELTIVKEESDSTNQTLDIVTTSLDHRWNKREIFFIATQPDYKIYFDLLKISTESSSVSIAFDEISIQQIDEEDQSPSSNAIAAARPPVLDPISSLYDQVLLSQIQKGIHAEPYFSTDSSMSITSEEKQIVYNCNFDNPIAVTNCFTSSDILISTGVGALTDAEPNGALSDVTSILKQTGNGEVCKLPYRIGSYKWDMFFCNSGFCPTKNSLNSSCESGKFGNVPLSNNSKLSFPLKTESGGIKSVGQQCLIYYSYMPPITTTIITIRKEERDGTSDTIDTVSENSFNKWMRRIVNFKTKELDYKIYFEVQKPSGTLKPNVGFDEILIHEGFCDEETITTTHESDDLTNGFVTTEQKPTSKILDVLISTDMSTKLETVTTAFDSSNDISTTAIGMKITTVADTSDRSSTDKMTTTTPIAEISNSISTTAGATTAITRSNTLNSTLTSGTLQTTTLSNTESLVTSNVKGTTSSLGNDEPSKTKNNLTIILSTVIPIATIVAISAILIRRCCRYRSSKSSALERKLVAKRDIELEEQTF